MKEEDFDFGLGEELEDDDFDLDLDFEDEFNDEDLEELPREGTPLYSVMMANGILSLEDRKRYHQYTPDNLGCSMENPIIIEETEDYVHLEYEILEYLIRPVPYRFPDYELEKQRLICHDGKYLDALTVKVYTHPLLDMDENGNFHRSEPVFLGTEEYWFDITAGYNAIGEMLKTDFEQEEKTEFHPMIEGEIASYHPKRETGERGSD